MLYYGEKQISKSNKIKIPKRIIENMKLENKEKLKIYFDEKTRNIILSKDFYPCSFCKDNNFENKKELCKKCLNAIKKLENKLP